MDNDKAFSRPTAKNTKGDENMEYKAYDTIKPKNKGKHTGKRKKTLTSFVNSGMTRWDIFKFDNGDTPQKAYLSLVQAAKRPPFAGIVEVVKDGNIVTLNRVG